MCVIFLLAIFMPVRLLQGVRRGPPKCFGPELAGGHCGILGMKLAGGERYYVVLARILQGETELAPLPLEGRGPLTAGAPSALMSYKIPRPVRNSHNIAKFIKNSCTTCNVVLEIIEQFHLAAA